MYTMYELKPHDSHLNSTSVIPASLRSPATLCTVLLTTLHWLQ